MTTGHLPNGVEAILNTQYNIATNIYKWFSNHYIHHCAFHASLLTDNRVWRERLIFYCEKIVNTKKRPRQCPSGRLKHILVCICHLHDAIETTKREYQYASYEYTVKDRTILQAKPDAAMKNLRPKTNQGLKCIEPRTFTCDTPNHILL
jgi:hypothetical protein